ncbi:hypothetical protein JL721_10365 [Aureococcus anophagefferens]|nr:hypothetical protein JL721_10365 [Aureococcus anophagefferens]
MLGTTSMRRGRRGAAGAAATHTQASSPDRRRRGGALGFVRSVIFGIFFLAVGMYAGVIFKSVAGGGGAARRRRRPCGRRGRRRGARRGARRAAARERVARRGPRPRGADGPRVARRAPRARGAGDAGHGRGARPAVGSRAERRPSPPRFAEETHVAKRARGRAQAGELRCWPYGARRPPTDARNPFPSLRAPVAPADAPLSAEPAACGLDFTLATQASVERLWMLDHVCRRWAGPVVVAVYGPRGAPVPAAPAACGAGRVEFVERLVDAKRYADHNAYPVNELRNLAIARVRTSHFLLCDVDLWPDEQLYAVLYDRLHALGASVAHNATFADPKVAIVVPAFSREVKTDCASSTGKEDHADAGRMASCHREAEAMPATFEGLKRCIVAKECHIFDRFNHDGHGTTDYKSWLNTKSKALRPVDCFLSNRYEPYVVLSRSFLTHFPHHKSAARQNWEKNSEAKQKGGDHKARMDALYQEFLAALIATP